MAYSPAHPHENPVTIPAQNFTIEGLIGMPNPCKGIVILLHTSGDDPHGLRDNSLAPDLWERNMGSLATNLLTTFSNPETSGPVILTPDKVDLMVERISSLVQWVQKSELQNRPLGILAAGVGATAALKYQAENPGTIQALVLQSAPLALVKDLLPKIKIPTLCLVGAMDVERVEENRTYFPYLACSKELIIIEGANRLFQSGDAWDHATIRSSDWFSDYLGEAFALRNANKHVDQTYAPSEEQRPKMC